jgi:acyl dehydratase
LSEEIPLALGAPVFSAALTMQAAVLKNVSESLASGARLHRSAVATFQETASAFATAWIPSGSARGPQAPAAKIPGTPADVGVGTEVSFTREVTDGMVAAFGEASGDFNPVHFDEAYARTQTSFGERIVHGLLTASFISAALSRLPGIVIYLEQDLRFVKPVKRGDVVTTTVTVTERPEGKSWARLKTTCALADGSVCLEGQAKVLLLPEKA